MYQNISLIYIKINLSFDIFKHFHFNLVWKKHKHHFIIYLYLFDKSSFKSMI